jgi:hypothetical protein
MEDWNSVTFRSCKHAIHDALAYICKRLNLDLDEATHTVAYGGMVPKSRGGKFMLPVPSALRKFGDESPQ